MTAAVETMSAKTQPTVRPVSLKESPNLSKSSQLSATKTEQVVRVESPIAKMDSVSNSTQPATVDTVKASNSQSINTKDSPQPDHTLKSKSVVEAASGKKLKGSSTTTKKGGNGENTGKLAGYPKVELLLILLLFRSMDKGRA